MIIVVYGVLVIWLALFSALALIPLLTDGATGR